MLKTILPLILIQFCLSTNVLAQKNFAKEADVAFANEAYYDATDLYKNAYPKVIKVAEKARIIFQIGECSRFTNNPNTAIESYKAYQTIAPKS